jgi:hypothetical protein
VTSRASCPAVFVPAEDWNDGEGHPPGAFTVETLTNGERMMAYNCPSDGREGWLRLRPCEERPSWDFNDDYDRPTLNPSVHRQRHRTGGPIETVWHGWLRNGEWVSC